MMAGRPKHICGAFDPANGEDRRDLCSFRAAKAISPDKRTSTKTT